jgi:hypothetical protein
MNNRRGNGDVVAAKARLDTSARGQKRFLVAAAQPVNPLSLYEFTRSTERGCARLAAGSCG